MYELKSRMRMGEKKHVTWREEKDRLPVIDDEVVR
jgi:hypothetical protein